MSSTDPPTRPSTATMTKGTRKPGRQHGGQGADRVEGDRAAQLGRRPGEQQAEHDQDDRGDRRAERGPPDDPAPGRAAGQVAGVVGGGVDPAEAEAGHHEHEGADELLRRAGVDGRDGRPVDLVGGQDDEGNGQHGRHDGDDRLQPHDQVEAEDAAEDGSARRPQPGRWPWSRLPPPQPSRLKTVAVASVARMTSTVSQPTVSTQETARAACCRDAERGAAEDHGRRGAALARHGNEAAEQERDDDADQAGHEGLPETRCRTQG